MQGGVIVLFLIGYLALGRNCKSLNVFVNICICSGIGFFGASRFRFNPQRLDWRMFGGNWPDTRELGFVGGKLRLNLLLYRH